MKHNTIVMELFIKFLSKSNLEVSYNQVIKNRGVAGIDNLKVSELSQYLRKNWTVLKSELEAGTYIPQPILGKEIPKRNKGKRLLGIPTVFDRMLQQGVHQVLSPIFEPNFSEFSFGFRKGKSAKDAILQAQRFINSGYNFIIDIDLKKFFDTVNHDFMMTLVHRKIKDVRMLKLIFRFLRSPILISGKLEKRRQGVPQGSPLSPLLSNILLNELDQHLESLGLRFVRYADDFSIFVKDMKTAEEVKQYIAHFISKRLHLEINEDKSSIVRPQKYNYLGFGFVPSYKKGDRGKYQIVTSPASFKELKRKIKNITRKTRPMSLEERIVELNRLMYGWVNYFRPANMTLKLKRLDSWVRRRLRYCIWKNWKKPNKRMRSYIRMGVPQGRAYSWSRSRMGGWAVAKSPIMLTTVTLERLQKRNYKSFLNYYTSKR